MKPIVANGECFWSCLDQVNELSGKYQIDIGNLSQPAVDALEQMGLTVVNKSDERGDYITCKSKNPIKAYNEAGDEMPCQIGNGSKAKVVLGYYDWTFKNKEGRSPSIQKLIITDLEVYEAAEVTDTELEEAL